jgi:hypothetical protein
MGKLLSVSSYQICSYICKGAIALLNGDNLVIFNRFYMIMPNDPNRPEIAYPGNSGVSWWFFRHAVQGKPNE